MTYDTHKNHALSPGRTPSGPLQRRLMSGAPLPSIVDTASFAPHDLETTLDCPEMTSASASGSSGAIGRAGEVGYATLGLLDGTIIAHIPCSDDLGTAVIGRGSLSDIRIHDAWIHREHALIAWDADVRMHVITHAGGANGTFVNLHRLSAPTHLNDGARVRVGKTEMVYRRIR